MTGIYGDVRLPRILIVEDNAMNREVLELMIGEHRAEIVSFSDGREALRTARERRFDLAFVDIRMPEFSGEDFLMAWRDFERSEGLVPMPVLACSANVMPEQVARYLRLGFDGHLPKPIHLRELHDLIEYYTGPAPQIAEHAVAS